MKMRFNQQQLKGGRVQGAALEWGGDGCESRHAPGIFSGLSLLFPLSKCLH